MPERRAIKERMPHHLATISGANSVVMSLFFGGVGCRRYANSTVGLMVGLRHIIRRDCFTSFIDPIIDHGAHELDRRRHGSSVNMKNNRIHLNVVHKDQENK